MITPDRKPPGSPCRVKLMATCLCDAFFDDVAIAAVEVLEHLGCTVDFPEDQTCCGQPAFNAGDWAASRKVVRHAIKVFAGNDPVILPSGSCAGMIFHSSLLAFENEPDLPQVKQLAARTWEIGDFIVNGLKVTQWPGRFPAKLAYHRSCHTRGTPSGDAARTLLRSIEGLDITEFGEGEQCCGFGGTFSVSFPNVSGAMGRRKLQNIAAAHPDLLASSDMACLLHLDGVAARTERPVKTMHLVQVLRDALRTVPAK